MTRKKLVILILALVLLPILWYLIFPAFQSTELNEALPGKQAFEVPEEKREAFNKAMQDTAGEVITKNNGMPNLDFRILAQGPMKAKWHDVKGEAIMFKFGDGKKLLRLENFETLNGPKLHIYLGADLEGRDFVDLGPLRATKGNVNYDVPSGTDTAKYKYVMVWCEPFSVLFSYAELK